MKTIAFILLLAVVLCACAPAAIPTATLPPPTATVPPPPTVPPAPTQPSFENMLVYDMPEMYQVKIKTLQFQTLHQPPELLTMDVYYPPNWQPGSRLPAVLMANSFPLSAEFGKCGRNCYSYPSWGRLIAANGLIAVTYDTKYANDLEALAKHVRANGADLGIDGNRLGVMGVSSDAPLAESFAYQEGKDYVKFGVFYYGYLLTPDNFMREVYNALCSQINCYGAELSDVKQLRTDLPVFVVRCGNDEDFNKEPVDRFAQLADKMGVPLTFVRFDEGSHVFDTLEGSTGQVRVRAMEIVKQTLEFMKAAASGQPIPTVPPPQTLVADPKALAADINATFQKATQSGAFSGAVLVAKNGQVILSQGYGFADRAKNIPNTPQTKFRIGGLTHNFTAMAILILQEQGKLTVQDKLCTYLTDCPDAWKPITLHQLLTHSSGTRYSWSPHTSLDKMIADAKAMPLAFQPGERFDCCNLDYGLLGKVIEAASGQTYEAFLQKNIFEPLQMSSTGYDHRQADLALGYASTGTSTVDLTDPEALFSFGALYSSLEDLYRWDQALYTDKLVSQKALDVMLTASQVPMPSDWLPGWGTSYSWLVAPGKPLCLVWNNEMSGFRSIIDRYPEDKSTIIILTNQENIDEWTDAELVGKKLFGLACGETVSP